MNEQHPDPTGPERQEGKQPRSTNGRPGLSIAEQAAEPAEPPIPESRPLGERGGQLPLPGTAAQRKKPVELVVQINQGQTPGAGQLDPDKEQLLIVRAEYVSGTPVAKRDSERQITGWKYVQKLRPTWVESIGDFLAANGWSIVDGNGDVVDLEVAADVEAIRMDREDALVGG